MKAEGITGADRVQQLAVIGDGAAWIWGMATARFPEATQIVDLLHARERVHLTGGLEFGALDQQGRVARRRLEDLNYGYIDGIVAAAHNLTGIKKNELEHRPRLLPEQRPGMRYHWFASARPCSSDPGSVEASCKKLPWPQTQTGRHALDVSGADAVVALRCSPPAAPGKPSATSQPGTSTRTA